MVKNVISNWDRLASDIESAVNESWQMQHIKKRIGNIP